MWRYWNYVYFSPYRMILGIVLLVAFFFLISSLFGRRRSSETYSTTATRVNTTQRTPNQSTNFSLEDRLSRGDISKEEYDILKNTTPNERL